MLAPQIIVAVEKRLRRSHRGRRTVYRREWSIAAGATRIDVAAINGKITGCEVKSARDNFSRLASQVKSYSAVLDTAVAVIEGDRAVSRVESLIPDWWGIWQAIESSRGPILRTIRETSHNPSPDPLAITQLVLRDEAYCILRKHSIHTGLRTATRWRIWNALADGLPLDTLQHEVREAIKARQAW
ncbi:sce7726 family protein [Lentzea rhizosphaerae]|uniref:Sce7726 family protein n=1 Tax=Lentzea rhizosphaerae TaxID=2041025 RepID=A0ABV8BPN0_9PSEU